MSSQINGIMPSYGSIDGGNDVDIYFHTNLYIKDRSLIKKIMFGDVPCTLYGSPTFVSDTILIFAEKYKSHALQKQCSLSPYLIQVIVPAGCEGKCVNVEIHLVSGTIITAKNHCYLYTEDTDNDSLDDIYKKMLSDDLPPQSIYETQGITEDIFHAPKYFYDVAQNRVEEVRRLLDSDLIDFNVKDLMGFFVLDVAKHHNRREIVELIEKKMREENQ